MQKAKRKIRLRVLAGLLGLWLAFFGVFTVWCVYSARETLLDEVYQSMEQLRYEIERVYMKYWDEREDTGLQIAVQPLDEIRAETAELLVAYKGLGEMELACYDEKLELLASSGAYMALNYKIEPVSERRQFGGSHYGLLDIDGVLPEEAAEKLKYYVSYSQEEYSSEMGHLNGYSVMFVGLWSDGMNLVPKKIVVLEERVTEATMDHLKLPSFDENGNMIEEGNLEIVWEYDHQPEEDVIADMVFCSDSVWWNYGTGRPGLGKAYPELMETVLDVQKVREAYGHGLYEEPGFVESQGEGAMVASGSIFVTEYFGYWCNSSLYSLRQTCVTNVMSLGGVYAAPIVVASGRVYPLKECAGTLMAVGAGSFLLFLMVAVILVWQLTRVYEKQAELEAQRRRTTNAMAHDLKTPMAAITGYAENLLENTRPDKQEKYLCAIYNQVGRMDETVGKMLELSRLEAEADKLDLTEFSLRELCREIMEDYLGDEVRFLLQGDAVIEADRAMMRRVLENFLSNARKHTAPGGVIEITVEQGKCTVFNPGDPIPEELLPKLWEAYYQADGARSQGGSGLGLSIVREILLRHGFTWGAENRDSGVAFWFGF